jgi:hypothetical protein
MELRRWIGREFAPESYVRLRVVEYKPGLHDHAHGLEFFGFEYQDSARASESLVNRIVNARFHVARRFHGEARGQGLVEFALVVPLLMLVIASTIDVGRGIYLYNGVSEAVREIARTDSVHACDSRPCTVGTSSLTAQTVLRQQALIPGLNTPTFACVAMDGSSAVDCVSGDLVKVTASVSFSPLMGLVGTYSLSSSSTVEIP